MSKAIRFFGGVALCVLAACGGYSNPAGASSGYGGGAGGAGGSGTGAGGTDNQMECQLNTDCPGGWVCNVSTYQCEHTGATRTPNPY
jgi:hypothetical protein